MAYYETLPTTNNEVAKLFQNLGYTDELVQEKYGLTRNTAKALYSRILAYHNNDFHITFYPGSTEQNNHDWKKWADTKPESFVLYFASVYLTLQLKGKGSYNKNELDFVTSTSIPFAITADTKPDQIFETLFQKIEDFSNSVQVSVIRQ